MWCLSVCANECVFVFCAAARSDALLDQPDDDEVVATFTASFHSLQAAIVGVRQQFVAHCAPAATASARGRRTSTAPFAPTQAELAKVQLRRKDALAPAAAGGAHDERGGNAFLRELERAVAGGGVQVARARRPCASSVAR